MSTRTLASITLEVVEPEDLNEPLAFRVTTDGDSEAVGADAAVAYAQQIDAMAGDQHSIEVAVAEALLSREQAVIAARQEAAGRWTEHLASLGVRNKSKARKATRTSRPEAPTAAPATEASATVDVAVTEPAPEPKAVVDVTAADGPVPATNDTPAEPPAEEDPFLDEVAPGEPEAEVTPEVAPFSVPRLPDGTEDLTEF